MKTYSAHQGIETQSTDHVYSLKKGDHPLLIQGGMGVGVSNWRLAKAVSILGHLGVVSGTGVSSMLVRRLQDGDPEGDVRRAISYFPDKKIAEELVSHYWIKDGKSMRQSYKRCALPSIDSPLALQQLTTVASFVEVFLAKENHKGIVGINFLEKLQTSILPGIYGAMLAGVDYVLVGAGIPKEIPGVLDLFSNHSAASIKVMFVEDKKLDNPLRIHFDPAQIFSKMEKLPLKRPKFLAIISSDTLASHLVRRSTGKVDGFIVEGQLAGGHNAPPRGPIHLNPRGEPIYGSRDVVDHKSMQEIGLPFWLAGSFGSPDQLKLALSLGAMGVQVGTAFAFCNESGISENLKKAVLNKWCFDKNHNPDSVFTDPLASPTGFPFKIVPLATTLSENTLYEKRPRKCDVGYLRQIVCDSDGRVTYRCPAEPVHDYIRKGGKVEDTVNRKCLCNALLSNVGMGQTQENGYEEEPLLTAGDELVQLSQFLPKEGKSYSARDVISYLMSKL